MAWAAVGGATAGYLLPKVFGGNEGGTQTVDTSPWGPYQDYLKSGAGELDEMRGSREYYGGDMVADLTPEQLKSIEMYKGGADTLSGYNQQLGGQMGMFADPSFMDPNKNPYQQQYVDAAIRPITQAYTEQGLPSIRAGSRMSGGQDYGNTRQGIAEGIMGRGYLDTVGDVTSKINTDLYGKNIDAVQRSMSMSPMYAQMMGMPASMYGQAGGVLQGQEQAETGAKVDKFNWERDLPTNDLYSFMNLLQNSKGGTQVTNTPDGGGADIMSMLGGAQLGSSLYNNWDSGGGGGWDAWDSSYDDAFRDPYELDW